MIVGDVIVPPHSTRTNDYLILSLAVLWSLALDKYPHVARTLTLFSVADFESWSTHGAIRAELHKQILVTNDRTWILWSAIATQWSGWWTVALVSRQTIVNAKRMGFDLKLVDELGNDVRIVRSSYGVVANKVVAVIHRIVGRCNQTSRTVKFSTATNFPSHLTFWWPFLKSINKCNFKK